MTVSTGFCATPVLALPTLQLIVIAAVVENAAESWSETSSCLTGLFAVSKKTDVVSPVLNVQVAIAELFESVFWIDVLPKIRYVPRGTIT